MIEEGGGEGSGRYGGMGGGGMEKRMGGGGGEGGGTHGGEKWGRPRGERGGGDIRNSYTIGSVASISHEYLEFRACALLALFLCKVTSFSSNQQSLIHVHCWLLLYVTGVCVPALPGSLWTLG